MSSIYSDEEVAPEEVAPEEKPEEKPEEEPGPSTLRRGRSARRGGAGRGGAGRGGASRGGVQRSRSPPNPPPAPWRMVDEEDSAPAIPPFCPRRPPGVQFSHDVARSAVQLFKLFFTASAMQTLCDNTNRYATKNQEAGKKFKWEKLTVGELYRFFGVLVFTTLVRIPFIDGYWSEGLLQQRLPSMVMARDRFRAIWWNLHPSNIDEDAKNDQLLGTELYDKLHRAKPLYDDVRLACQATYHPRQQLAVDERMVASKGKSGMTQYMKDKPTKWGMKLFVLADSSNGYCFDFRLYSGKTHTPVVHGLAYDVVMQLVNPSFIGTGYHVYVDNFYTSPALFTALRAQNIGACGTYRENRKGCPAGRDNAMPKKSERGTIRWLRDGPIVFVKWMDTKEVSVCSTIHRAFTGETVERRVKQQDGRWTRKAIPCPDPIVDYNKYMGGVDRSDQLLRYYSGHRRANRWYRTILLHLFDIATTNAFVLHRDVAQVRGDRPLPHSVFMQQLCEGLCGVEMGRVPANRSTTHVPVPLVTPPAQGRTTATGRRVCQRCSSVDGVRKDTQWKCQACNVPLCLIPDRNCFAKWHV